MHQAASCSTSARCHSDIARKDKRRWLCTRLNKGTKRCAALQGAPEQRACGPAARECQRQCEQGQQELQQAQLPPRALPRAAGCHRRGIAVRGLCARGRRAGAGAVRGACSPEDVPPHAQRLTQLLCGPADLSCTCQQKTAGQRAQSANRCDDTQYLISLDALLWERHEACARGAFA